VSVPFLILDEDIVSPMLQIFSLFVELRMDLSS